MGIYCGIREVTAEEAEQLRSPGVETTIARLSKQVVSLEKAWHGLHYLLTGSADQSESPLGFLVQGGEHLVPDEASPRLFSPESTKALALALAEVSDERLWERFDAQRMTEEVIYPGIWDEPEEELREEYLGYFHALKGLIHRASAANHGLLVTLS